MYPVCNVQYTNMYPVQNVGHAYKYIYNGGCVYITYPVQNAFTILIFKMQICIYLCYNAGYALFILFTTQDVRTFFIYINTSCYNSGYFFLTIFFIAFIQLYIENPPRARVRHFRGLEKTTIPPQLGMDISAFEYRFYYKRRKQKKAL